MSIKLKMGKDKQETAEQPDSKSNNPSEEELNEDENKEETEEKSEKNEKKEDVEKLRKVIKVDDDSKDKEERKHDKNEDADSEITGREGLEQKRAILQSIKDFDFQIKKNQEEITGLNKKLETVSRDLDDLVSLYEIVSEQMNPFVGLSKVTKKRIDALENFTSEIENLKDRVNQIETFSGGPGANVNTETKDTQTDSEMEEKDVEELNADEENQINQIITYSTEHNQGDDLDKIIEQSFYALSQEMKIDRAIDNFIENLKTNNVN